jgi:CRISPR-associated endonuclease Csn1
MKEKKNYRLGIDMGATSLGWCMLKLDKDDKPCGIIKMGVRIFPDGRDDKSKEPLNVTRRTARSIRRNRERYKRRRESLLRILRENGLMPNDIAEGKKLEKIDPYELRVKGLDEKLSLYELGRAIFHLNQRRGFKSNLIIDKGDNDSSAMKNSIKELKSEIKSSKCRSLGEYQYTKNEGLGEHEQHRREAIRVRVTGTEKNKIYSIFPERQMIEDELILIWEKQQAYYPQVLTNDLLFRILGRIIAQRPLKPQDKGKCIFEPEEDRILRCNPEFQIFRIMQTVNQLELRDEYGECHDLTLEQKLKLIDYLKQKKKVTFSSLRGKLGKQYKTGYTFNLESEKRKDVEGDETGAILAKADNFGDQWYNLARYEQVDIVRLLMGEDKYCTSKEDIQAKLQGSYVISAQQIENCLEARLVTGTGNLCEKAIRKIIPGLEKGLMYHEACLEAGYKHSGDVIKPEYQAGNLPYYGKIMPNHVIKRESPYINNDETRYGKISNVTVHIALNQLQKLVNAVSKKYGAPKQIVLELARDLKLNKKQKEELKKRQNRETKENERIGAEIESLGIKNNYANRLKYKLWEELCEDPFKRCCPFSGKTICKAELFSEKVQIEHILPKSKTFDDRRINKTLAWYKANQDKGERSPFDAFGKSPTGYNWDEILMRAENLPKAKYERFFSDAMERWGDEGEILGRMLNDTRYMSRLAREYMSYVAGSNNVWVIPGGMTSRLRYHWGFNGLLSDDDTKNRNDHRHHAIDALVIALTSRAMLQIISQQIGRGNERFIENMPEPYQGFDYEKTQTIVDNIMVSFKPDHKFANSERHSNISGGRLHKDTAYGLREKDEKGEYHLHVRKPVSEFTKIKKANQIADPVIRAEVEDLIIETGNANEYFHEKRINKLRIIERKNPDTLVSIKNEQDEKYKYYVSGNNFCCDVYCPIKGKKAGKWQLEIIPMLKAHQKDFRPQWQIDYPAAKKIMRFFINDTAIMKIGEEWQVRRVRKMTGASIYLRSIFIAADVGDVGEQFSGSSLQNAKTIKAGIDILGRINPQVPSDENS